MIIKNWPLRSFVVLTSALLFSMNVFAQSDPGSRKPKIVTYTEAQSVKELYVGIMGEVNKPGTYHLDASTLNLHSVVLRAAGFTPDASRVIRVIRQGKVCQKEIYSQSSNSPLLPGDLLVVDARQVSGFSGRVMDFASEPTMVHASYQERARTNVIQVGLVNLLDYPVVVKMRPEDANSAKIVEGLRQPLQLLADADVIVPERRLTSDVAKQMPRLPDGSVIVFKRDAVKRDNLPATLPKPIESDIALGAQYGMIGSPLGQSFELRSLGQQLLPGADSVDSTFRVPGANDSELPSPYSSQTRLSGDGSVGNPRIANVPFAGSPRIKTSSTVGSRHDGGSIEIPESSISETEPSPMEEGPSLNAEDATDSSTSGFSAKQIWIVFSIIGTIMLVAIVGRKFLEASFRPTFHAEPSIESRPAAPVATAMPQVPFESKPLLEKLIKNELPIQMEQVEFPLGLMLQGRIAPQPILRVDGPQSILKQQGPHFSSMHQPQDTFQEVISQFDQPETPPVRKPHFLDAEPRKVEAAVPRSPGDGPAKSPFAKALFDLEQGGRT